MPIHMMTHVSLCKYFW